MVSKTTLNAKNLEALGASRLAELLIEVGAGDAAVKRRLRLELAGAANSGEIGREIRKRLKTIARSQSFVEWHKIKALILDLDAQRRAIAEQVAKTDPAEALDLMWELAGLADSVLGRCDDRTGGVVDVFHAVVNDLGAIALAAHVQPMPLADRTFDALIDNGYGQYDGLIESLAPALGEGGLDHLKARFIELSNTPIPTAPDEERRVIGWGTGGPVYADDHAERHRDITIRLALQAIADAQGDVDAYIAQKTEAAKTVPSVAADIAQRLLAVGRVEDAWHAINAVKDQRPDWIPFEWEETRIKVLEALGRPDEAQAFRWACFERSLNEDHLRNYLKRLPDFDDIEAEERAIAHALRFPDTHRALHFLVSLPALDQAAKLVLAQSAEWNGDYYQVLTPAADALETKHPLAATILRRAMVDFTLINGRAKRYRHAARHLLECESLARSIADFGALPTHEAYVQKLKAEHGRKSGFWSLVS